MKKECLDDMQRQPVELDYDVPLVAALRRAVDTIYQQRVRVRAQRTSDNEAVEHYLVLFVLECEAAVAQERGTQRLATAQEVIKALNRGWLPDDTLDEIEEVLLEAGYLHEKILPSLAYLLQYYAAVLESVVEASYRWNGPFYEG